MRIRLNVAAPIRVGGRERQVNKLEYVRHGGKLHAISPRKLAELLQSKSERTLVDWNNEVLRKGQNADLTAFLRGENLLDAEVVERTGCYSVLCDHQNLEHPFQPHARDAFGRLFVPGTAIKGAVRAAVMWARVDKDTADDYVKKSFVEAEERNRRPRRDRFGETLDQQALQTYRLPRPGGTAAHRDLLRSVKIFDAYGELESRVEKIIVQSYTESRRGRTAALGAPDTIYVECLAPDSWVEFDLKVDRKIIRDFKQENGDKDIPFDNESSLLDLVRDFYAEVWSFERRYYGVADSEGEVPTLAEEPKEFPKLEEWIEQEKGIPKGTLSKTQQRRYRGEWRVAHEDFEAGRGGKERQMPGTETGIQDGEVRVGEIKNFYAGVCPGFRLGWGSGLMSTTIDMRLDNENMGKVLNIINDKHHPHGNTIEGPKSRKLVESGGGPRWPMGWARLEVTG